MIAQRKHAGSEHEQKEELECSEKGRRATARNHPLS